jgi:hypothetical protein
MDAGWTNNALRAGAVAIRNGGKLKHWRNSDTAAPWVPDAGIFLECTTLTVDTNGEINADYVGYGGGNQVSGYGPGKGTHGTYTGGGGGYGGAGGSGSDGTGGSTNGSSNNPADPGSGGGGGDANSPQGGAGGGYIRILAAGTVTINGTITANGAGGSVKAGGGSGGGICIRCLRLTGAGNIRANGGNPSNTDGGGGGGGRIALYIITAPYYLGTIAFTPTVAGGTATTYPGGAGTIYRNFKPRGTMFSAW